MSVWQRETGYRPPSDPWINGGAAARGAWGAIRGAKLQQLALQEVLEPLVHDAGAERASSAGNDPRRHSRPMLGAEFFGSPHNGACCCNESFTESPVISRGVIGTFGESSGNRHWRYSSHASIRPELVCILHLLFPLPDRSGDGPGRPPVLASQPARRGTLLHLVALTVPSDLSHGLARQDDISRWDGGQVAAWPPYPAPRLEAHSKTTWARSRRAGQLLLLARFDPEEVQNASPANPQAWQSGSGHPMTHPAHGPAGMGGN
jgi:hypothetical protein